MHLHYSISMIFYQKNRRISSSIIILTKNI